MNTNVLIIPCETQAREFDAKLLLACFAAEHGFRVIVGSNKEINRRIGSLPRSIFLSKNLTIRSLNNYRLLERLGHFLICGDEEGLVYASEDSYLHHKVAAATLNKARVLMAWGSENARIWSHSEGYDGVPIHVTGNPRMDLLRPELRPIFEAKASELRERFGAFVLINTNFSRLNHYLPRQSRQREALESGPVPSGGMDLGRGLAAHKSELYDYFLEMVPALAKACPEHTIVIRPHPSEKHETWIDATRPCSNVEVLKEGNVVPWLLASEVMVHNGCQTAVESYLLESCTVAYQPVTSDDFDLQLPNLLSHRAFNLDDLISCVQAQLSGTLEKDPSEAQDQEDLINRNLTARSGPFSCERIVLMLAEFAEKSEIDARPPLGEWLPSKIAAEARGLKQRIQAYVPGSHNSRVYLDHMFPGASLADVEDRIATYGHLLERFKSVRATERSKYLFEITAA